MYNKLRGTEVKQFNLEDDKQTEKVKQTVKYLPFLKLPLDKNYLIAEYRFVDINLINIHLKAKNKFVDTIVDNTEREV